MARFLEPVKGRAVLTNFNQTAEKKSIEEWPLFAELCTDTPLCRENPIYFYVDEIVNATLKIGVYSPAAQLDRKKSDRRFRADSPSPSEHITSPVLNDGTLWYWNTKSVHKGHWTAVRATSIPEEIKPFYGSSKEIKQGSLLGVCRKNNGDLHFTVDGTDMGIAARRVPENLYGFIRIAVSGSSGRIKITLRSLASKPLDLDDFDIIEKANKVESGPLNSKCNYNSNVKDLDDFDIIEKADKVESRCINSKCNYNSNVKVGHHSVLLPRYNMGSRPRGICVIINNKSFRTKEKRRDGTEKDEEILKTLFTKLHFIVDLKRDLTRDKMEAVMRHYGRMNHSRYNAFICIIMSHGRENDCIEGVDEKTVRIEEIMAEFDAQHCPSLKAKPKLFFIQSCRGRSWDEQWDFVNSFSALDCSVQSDGSALQADSTLVRSACPKGADFLLAFATTPGYVALRLSSEGSVYVRILADVIRELHKDVHLLDMLTVVNCKVSEEVFALSEGRLTQIPAPATTLRAQVYL